MDEANIEVSRPLNYLTARPTLEPLLALSDYEAPDVAPDDTLAVFADCPRCRTRGAASLRYPSR
jgi:hypothetical protein